jgi:cytochrome c6
MTMSNTLTKLFWILLFFSAACGSVEEDAGRNAASKKGDSALVPDGMAIFRQKCVTCHGADGKLGLNGAKDLSQSIVPLEERINIITHGKNLMTPFGTLLSPEEIKAVAEYTLSLKK